MYLILKNFHMAFAALAITGFLLRGYWHATNSKVLQSRATRILPHLSDALFLATGVWLIMILELNVLQHPWLLGKFAGLTAYIGLGMVAFRFAITKRGRSIAFAGAVLSFAYIVGAAIQKSPGSWFA